MLVVFLYFTIPDPVVYVQKFIKFLAYSQKGNDFVIWRRHLLKYFEVPESFRGAGWPWIFKYFFFAMPIMFVTYLVALFYVLFKSKKDPKLPVGVF